jgi:hypothetical protein
MNGVVTAICICSKAGGPMQSVEKVDALAGKGLSGDRYADGAGSFNRGNQGERQVTLVNSIFFEGTDFKYVDSRRNIVTTDVELMWLIGREFQIGTAIFRGVKYSDPCARPSKLSGKKGFRDAFFDRGGIVAEVIKGGCVRINDPVIPPPKGY